MNNNHHGEDVHTWFCFIINLGRAETLKGEQHSGVMCVCVCVCVYLMYVASYDCRVCVCVCVYFMCFVCVCMCVSHVCCIL